MKQFKIRASATGQIMGNPRLKADKEAGNLSATAKTYCEKWLKEQIYDRKIEFSTKFTEKGLINEDESIDFAAQWLDLGFVLKNEESFENDFMTGTPDMLPPSDTNLVIDIKNSWDFSTFPLFADDIPTKDYYYQLQVYMHLTGRKKAMLVYTLTDTPLVLIEREARYYASKWGYEADDIIDEYIDRMTYGSIPSALKIKSFNFEYDSDVIKKIEAKVLKCREYINELYKKL